MTLRRRLLAYLALTAVASCALTVGVAVLLVRHRVATQRVTTLENQADAAAGTDTLTGSRVFRVVGGRPRRLAPARARAVLSAVPASTSASGTTTVGRRALLYVIRPAALGRVVLIGPATIGFAEWRPFLLSLVVAGIGGALLAVVLALILARRLVAPVRDLALATQRLAEGDEQVTVAARGEDELAALARSFNAMSVELGRSRAAQRRFLESVSHELRTPLTSIRGYAEALQEGAVDAQTGSGVISAEAQRLERLVADLLELARLGREDFPVACRELDLAALAAQAVKRHRPQAHRLGVALELVDGGPAPALGDEHRLLQVASNLIENALRLTPREGRVEVRSAPGALTVRDSGPGLAPEDLPRAFERFYLHSRYRSDRPVGSGLGLAIVQELTRAMGGEVSAGRPPDGGAEFVVHLPTPALPERPDAGRPSA